MAKEFCAEPYVARGIADLAAVANLLADRPFLFGDRPHSTDAAAYGFLANSWRFPIETAAGVHRRERQPGAILRADARAGHSALLTGVDPLQRSPSRGSGGPR